MACCYLNGWRCGHSRQIGHHGLVCNIRGVCVCVRCHATKTLQPKTTTYTEHLSVDVAKCCSRLEWPWAASHTSVAMSARGARAPLSRHAHADHLTRATPWPIDIVLGACPRRLLEFKLAGVGIDKVHVSGVDISKHGTPADLEASWPLRQKKTFDCDLLPACEDRLERFLDETHRGCLGAGCRVGGRLSQNGYG